MHDIDAWIATLTARIDAWARSPEGQSAMKQAVDDAKAASAAIREAARIDWRDMQERITI